MPAIDYDSGKVNKPKEEWEAELNKFYGSMFEAGDYEKLVKFISSLLTSEREKVKLTKIICTHKELCLCDGYNLAVDDLEYLKQH